MKQTILLTQLRPGQKAIVSNISAKGRLRRRLQDLGLVKGCRVTCIEYSPLGDPIAYRIGGAVVALRHEASDTVFVEEESVNDGAKSRR